MFQNTSSCTGPIANSCIESVSKRHTDCKISCIGLYAVVWYLETNKDDNENSGQKFARMTSAYHRYLNNYAGNLVYNSSSKDLSENFSGNISYLSFNSVSASPKAFPPLSLVEIYFVPASYDEIERDRKLTVEAQLGLIGGTMGLLTGFSILRLTDWLIDLVEILD